MSAGVASYVCIPLALASTAPASVLTASLNRRERLSRRFVQAVLSGMLLEFGARETLRSEKGKRRFRHPTRGCTARSAGPWDSHTTWIRSWGAGHGTKAAGFRTARRSSAPRSALRRQPEAMRDAMVSLDALLRRADFRFTRSFAYRHRYQIPSDVKRLRSHERQNGAVDEEMIPNWVESGSMNRSAGARSSRGTGSLMFDREERGCWRLARLRRITIRAPTSG